MENCLVLYHINPLRAAIQFCVPGSSLYVPVQKNFMPAWTRFVRNLRFTCHSKIEDGYSIQTPLLQLLLSPPMLHDVRKAIIADYTLRAGSVSLRASSEGFHAGMDTFRA